MLRRRHSLPAVALLDDLDPDAPAGVGDCLGVSGPLALHVVSRARPTEPIRWFLPRDHAHHPDLRPRPERCEIDLFVRFRRGVETLEARTSRCQRRRAGRGRSQEGSSGHRAATARMAVSTGSLVRFELIAVQHCSLLICVICPYSTCPTVDWAWRASRPALTSCHALDQDIPGAVLNRDQAVVRVLAVEASLLRLIGVLEPVKSNHKRQIDKPVDVACEPVGTVLLCCDRTPGTFCVRKAGVHRLEAELGQHDRPSRQTVNILESLYGSGLPIVVETHHVHGSLRPRRTGSGACPANRQPKMRWFGSALRMAFLHVAK